MFTWRLLGEALQARQARLGHRGYSLSLTRARALSVFFFFIYFLLANVCAGQPAPQLYGLTVHVSRAPACRLRRQVIFFQCRFIS